MTSGFSNGAKLLTGCRTLIDSLISTSQAYSSAAAITSKVKPKAPRAASSGKKPAAGVKKEVNRSSGIFKPVQVSPTLAAFLGTSECARSDVVKHIWSHIKLNNLQSPADKRLINCDEKLKAVFGGKDQVGFLEIAKLLAPHFVKSS